MLTYNPFAHHIASICYELYVRALLFFFFLCPYCSQSVLNMYWEPGELWFFYLLKCFDY